jgi:hypothetical protein
MLVAFIEPLVLFCLRPDDRGLIVLSMLLPILTLQDIVH